VRCGLIGSKLYVETNQRGVRSGPKPKLTRQRIAHARKLIDKGQRREDVAGLFKVGRTTLYRARSAS
jgi:DNA invertase Pin-like site-specific DNA recombinase